MQEVTGLIDGFAWDSMGILAFSKSFNMLHGSPPKMMRMMRDMGRGAAALVCASWAVIFLRNMVGVRRVTVQWLEWCAQEVEERKRRSVCSFLMGAMCAMANSLRRNLTVVTSSAISSRTPHLRTITL